MSNMEGGTTILAFIFSDLNGNLHMIMGLDSFATTETNGVMQIVDKNAIKHMLIAEKFLLLMGGNALACQIWFDVIKQTFDKVPPQCTPDEFAQKVHHILKGINELPAQCGAVIGGWYNETPFFIDDATYSTRDSVVGYMTGSFKTFGSGSVFAKNVISKGLSRGATMDVRSAEHMAKIALTYAAHMDSRTGGFAKLFYSANSSLDWSCVSIESLDSLKDTYSVAYCVAFCNGEIP